MTTVRLPADIEQKLASASQEQSRSKSDIIRDALEMFFVKEESNDSYMLGANVFGKYGNGETNLSADYKKILKEKLHDKYDID
jgi:predicted DNA-binding protein